MLARILSRDGYATGAFGTWHQAHAWEGNADGPLDAEAVVDRAICWVDQVRASTPEKPWFTCLSFGAGQPPVQDVPSRRRHSRSESAQRPKHTRFLQHLQRRGELDHTIVLY
jgi:arylsulfatase A-like enzyme